ncbi:MAG: nicotinamide-nucleotide amidohydrolase family protein [Methanomassiliicoccaceae archaeon]|jgi:PncC family amidohydrolase|nr:nicotinamide-nucleotide amidohydrolase family protein [Methanomassiliicoccaceae archaeon]
MISDASVRLAGLLLKNGYTLSLAESCTGGGIASRITDVPGASVSFAGCAVTYSNASKEKILGVPRGTLERYGAVSAETAKAMADGARKLFGTDIAASATGIAGPDGGTSEKPVGTVFIAVSDKNATGCARLSLKGSRNDIREAVAESVIRMLIGVLDGSDSAKI